MKTAAITFEPTGKIRLLVRRRRQELGLPNDASSLDFILNEALLMAGNAVRLEQFIAPMKYLLLDEHQHPRACTIDQWAAWDKTNPDISVDYTIIGESAIGTKFVSVLPHENAPCWETNVIGGSLNGIRDVCRGNRDQAEQMHERVVSRVREAQAGGGKA